MSEITADTGIPATEQQRPVAASRRIVPAGVARLAGQVALLAVLLGAVEYVVRAGIVGSLFLAAPSQMVAALWRVIEEGGLEISLAVTLWEFAVGLAAAIAAGLAVGLFLVLVGGMERFFSPYLAALMAVPKVTLIPLFTLWLGIGLAQKALIVFFFAFFPIVYGVIAGIKQTSDNHLKVARAFRASHAQTIRLVILPSAVPTIFAGLRVAVATGIVGAIFGEMLAAKDGLGARLVQATSLYDTAQAFALIAVITLVSVALIALIDFAERRIFLRWKHA